MEVHKLGLEFLVFGVFDLDDDAKPTSYVAVMCFFDFVFDSVDRGSLWRVMEEQKRRTSLTFFSFKSMHMWVPGKISVVFTYSKANCNRQCYKKIGIGMFNGV